MAYFFGRYFDGASFTHHFAHLNLRANDKPKLVENVLSGAAADDESKMIALLIIIYRLRNIRYALGRALIVGRKCDPDVAVVENGIVLAIGFGNLIQGLGDQIGPDAVTRHEGKRCLKEIQPPQRRKFVQHQKQLVLAALGGIALQALGQASADLIEDQAHQGFGSGNIGRRNDEIERHWPGGIHEISNAPVAAGGRQALHTLPSLQDA